MTDQPTDPSDATEPSAADARWFRDAVEPVLDDRAVPDAWPAIRDQATGAVAPLLAHPASRRSTRRWLAAAAVVAVLAAIGGAMAATRSGDDDSTDLAADGPRGPSGPTGFYLPTDLPAGWELTAFQELSDRFDAERCPCDRGTWRDGTRTIWASRLADALGEDTRWEPWSGAPGGFRYAGPDGTIGFQWSTGGTATVVGGSGFDDPAEAERLVSAWIGADLATPPGWDEIERSSVGDDIQVVYQAYGELWNEELDLVVPFQLGPELAFGVGPDPLLLATEAGVETVPVAGSDRTLIRWDDAAPGFVGTWPGGATFQIGSGLGEGAISDGVDEDQVLALAASFEPASAAAWRQTVEQIDTTGRNPNEVEVLRRALIHPTIDGLVFRDGDRVPGEGDDPLDGAEPLPEDGLERPRVTIPAGELPSRPLPTAPGANEPGSPAVADPVNTLAVETEPAMVTVTTGDPFAIAVTITNQTDRPVSVGSCFPAGASWTLEQDGRPLGSMGAFTVDCGGDRPGLLEPGNTLPVRPPQEVFTFSASTDSGEQISPGRYEAVIRLAALDEPIRVPVTVVAR